MKKCAFVLILALVFSIFVSGKVLAAASQTEKDCWGLLVHSPLLQGVQGNGNGFKNFKNTVGLAVQKADGEVVLLVDHYIFGSHESLHKRANFPENNTRLLWAGEIKWRLSTGGRPVLQQLNETSGYFSSNYVGQLPASEIADRKQLFWEWLKSQTQFQVQASGIDTFDKRSPHFSQALNDLLAVTKRAGSVNGSLRHASIANLTAVYSYMDNLLTVKERDREDLFEKLFGPASWPSRKNLFTIVAHQLNYLITEASLDLGPEDLAQFQEVRTILENADENIFAWLYGNPDKALLIKTVAFSASESFKGKGWRYAPIIFRTEL